MHFKLNREIKMPRKMTFQATAKLNAPKTHFHLNNTSIYCLRIWKYTIWTQARVFCSFFPWTTKLKYYKIHTFAQTAKLKCHEILSFAWTAKLKWREMQFWSKKPRNFHAIKYYLLQMLWMEMWKFLLSLWGF